MAKLEVGILGATGMVGQRFLQLLEHHPWFHATWLAASDRSAGRRYADAVRWKLATDLPESAADIIVEDATPERWGKRPPRIIFAALDSKVAAQIEPQYVSAGCVLISNSSALRMHENIPLLIPEINADHLQVITGSPNAGFAVTNPNCSATGLAMALAPLHRDFGVEKVFVTTMQAVSGAGYPGVASLDILGNVVPFISNEEEKLETECQKMLGTVADRKITFADFTVSAHCNRVAVEDGHTESVSLKLRRPATAEQIIKSWRSFHGEPQKLDLPSAPKHPVIYLDQPDRPQPRRRGVVWPLPCLADGQ